MSDQPAPLMPKAVAVWLVSNSSLSFGQIADFCKLHPLEVRSIADGDGAKGIRGLDPLLTGQLTKEELELGLRDSSHRLRISGPMLISSLSRRKGGVASKYTPIARRQDRPNAILGLLRSHPELGDVAIARLARTTKNTVRQVRDRTHWNMHNLVPRDPVSLRLCTQLELDRELDKVSKSRNDHPDSTNSGG